MSKNESDLIRRAKDGDSSAFEDLVLTHQTKVYNLALRMTGNPEDALDLSQETFIRVYKALPLFKGQSTFSTWIYSIASNICLDFLRKQKKKKAVSISFSDLSKEDDSAFELPDSRFDPEREYEKAELRDAIAAGLDTLSPEHREILILREINGLSYREICDALDLEEGTVKSRISRARLQLCNFLGNNSGKKASKERKGR